MSQPTSEPNAKRKRTNENQVDEIIRSDIWFEDGNIILQAETTQYRVHKGVLSRNSGFFRGMFTVPQPQCEPTIEGCAVVHVADTEEDWTNVLAILYDNVRTHKSGNVISMLRLGYKYEFDYLQKEALERLKVDLPRTLDQWDKTYGEDENRREFDYHIFDLVNLLLELRIQSALPVAYLVCLDDYNLHEIVLGSNPDESDDENTGVDTRVVHLSPTAKAALVLGYQDLSVVLSRLIEKATAANPNVDQCYHVGVCNAERTELMRWALKTRRKLALISPRIVENLPDRTMLLCSGCIIGMRKEVQNCRQEFWEKLPLYFDLPAWDDLEDD